MICSKSTLAWAVFFALTPWVASSQDRDRGRPMPHEPSTTDHCTTWYENNGQLTCMDIVNKLGVPLRDLLRWNPSLTPGCGNWQTGLSYCIQATEGTVVTDTFPPSTPTTKPSTGSTLISSTTRRANNIPTPKLAQPGMVSNCDSFYFVNWGDGCQAIAAVNEISMVQFVEWNPSVKDDCSALLAETFVCVSVIEYSQTTKAHPTATTAGNGIATPTPILDHMASNCNSFYKVRPGDGCAAIAAAKGIPLEQFYSWNPSVGYSCQGLWRGYYVCDGIVTFEPTVTKQVPPTTTQSHRVVTPTPTQIGMADDCNAFHFVQVGNNCATIATKHGINKADLIKWNPAMKDDCSGIWAGTFACIGLI